MHRRLVLLAALLATLMLGVGVRPAAAQAPIEYCTVLVAGAVQLGLVEEQAARGLITACVASDTRSPASRTRSAAGSRSSARYQHAAPRGSGRGRTPA